MLSDLIEQYDTAFSQYKNLNDSVLSVELRQKAFEDFTRQGFPNRRNEAWKYTSLHELTNQLFLPAPKPNAIDFDISQYIEALSDSYYCVFVNGHYQPQLANLPVNDAIIICSINDFDHQNRIARHINGAFDDDSDALISMNTAFMQDGYYVYLAPNQSLDKPLHVLFFNTEHASYTRNIIILDEMSHATITDHYIGLNDASYFTNAVSEIYLYDDARLNHIKMQQESSQAHHLTEQYVQQSKNTGFNSFYYSLGGKLARTAIQCYLNEEHACANLTGLYLAQQQQHTDYHTQVDHLAPHTNSNELYKGIATDSAHSVFNGKAVIHQDAMKVSAHQSNKNLLLSNQAEIDTKPDLEIYTDDVVCSHGATVGQLDEQALFYLQSRGLDKSQAQQMLLAGFVDEILAALPDEDIKNQINSVVNRKLTQGFLA